jgi:hypothetical protein
MEVHDIERLATPSQSRDDASLELELNQRRRTSEANVVHGHVIEPLRGILIAGRKNGDVMSASGLRPREFRYPSLYRATQRTVDGRK